MSRTSNSYNTKVERVERLESDEIPLHAASSSGISNIAWELLDRGVDVNQKNSNGLTALHLASRHGEINMVRLLLARGASLHDKTNEGNNALMMASFRGHKDVIELLLDRGANIHEKNDVNFNALILASLNGHKDVAELLIERGADIYEKDCEGYTALQIATIKGHEEIAQLLQTEYDRILSDYVSLLEGVIVNDKLSIDWTKIIEMLVRYPFLIEEKTAYNETALLIAVNQRSTAAVRLVMMGANLNVVDKNGQTALSIGYNTYNESLRNFFIKNSF